MQEIKELEEARYKMEEPLDILLCAFSAYEEKNISSSEMLCYADDTIDQILNLKGDGWRIAIVCDWEFVYPDGKEYAQIIWVAPRTIPQLTDIKII